MKKQLLTVLFSFLISSFISAQVVANQPDPLALCDVNNPGDESEAFDLTTQNPFVLDGQDPANYTVTYYDNQADADAGTNALPFTYTNTVNPQTIYVRVEEISTGNNTTTTLTLWVNPNPSPSQPNAIEGWYCRSYKC